MESAAATIWDSGLLITIYLASPISLVFKTVKDSESSSSSSKSAVTSGTGLTRMATYVMNLDFISANFSCMKIMSLL